MKECSGEDVVKLEEKARESKMEKGSFELSIENLFVHKILSRLYSKVVYFLCHLTFKLGEKWEII